MLWIEKLNGASKEGSILIIYFLISLLLIFLNVGTYMRFYVDEKHVLEVNFFFFRNRIFFWSFSVKQSVKPFVPKKVITLLETVLSCRYNSLYRKYSNFYSRMTHLGRS